MNWELYEKCLDVVGSIDNETQIKIGSKFISLALRECERDCDIMTAHHICDIKSCAIGPIFKINKPEWVRSMELVMINKKNKEPEIILSKKAIGFMIAQTILGVVILIVTGVCYLIMEVL